MAERKKKESETRARAHKNISCGLLCVSLFFIVCQSEQWESVMQYMKQLGFIHRRRLKHCVHYKSWIWWDWAGEKWDKTWNNYNEILICVRLLGKIRADRQTLALCIKTKIFSFQTYTFFSLILNWTSMSSKNRYVRCDLAREMDI